jgi:hypothetical protein
MNNRITAVVVEQDPVSRRVNVQAPYSPTFNERAKQLGGKWDGTSKRWVFNAFNEAAVRALCVEVHGTDGGTAVVTREVLEARLAKHLQAVVEIQEQLAQMDGQARAEGEA